VSTTPDSSEGAGLDPGLDPAQDREVLRLRWQCRRGMLELDLLLNRFLETGYPDLGEAERVTFNRLLAYQDQVLHDWFMGHAVPADGDLRDLLARIRAAMLA
jgi:antitoxin CptB